MCVAVFDGEKFDVQGRVVESGLRPHTLWGWIAYRLGGAPLYEEVRYHDEHRIAPGGDVIIKLLGRTQSPEPPTLIMLDEVLKYFERANAESVAVGQSTLGRQTLDFIQSLSIEVANSSHAVMIYSLQASAGEAFGNVALLNMLDHLTARVDAKREPVVGDEILPVLQRRLLNARPDESITEAVADSHANLVTSMRSANARTVSEKRAAQDEHLTLRKRYQLAYPFHPALIDLMKDRWAAIPDFQRTRGALRFLSTALHALKEGSSLLLGPGDVPWSIATCRMPFSRKSASASRSRPCWKPIRRVQMRVFESLAQAEFEAWAVVVDKTALPDPFKVMHGLDLYVYFATALIQLIPSAQREGATLILDEFGSAAQLRTELRRFMTARGIPRHFKRVLAMRSRSEGLIQIADLMAGAILRRDAKRDTEAYEYVERKFKRVLEFRG